MHAANGIPIMKLARGAALAALLAGTFAVAGTTPARAADETEIKVERVRPEKEKHPTLRFLKENRDFIRGELDRVREKVVSQHGDAGVIDPRFLAYRDMLATLLAAKDSVALADDARQRRDLLASVTQLGDLEAELDQLERQLADQRTRLGVLQHDFTGDQRTALVVVLSGYPGAAAVSQVALTLEDGTSLAIPLTDPQRDALRTGGIVQVFHGFVEPREQVVAVSLAGAGWPAGDAGYVTLDPARDRLTMLKFNLSTVRPDQGASSIQATTWLHDERVP
jgi:hypothetical protein